MQMIHLVIPSQQQKKFNLLLGSEFLSCCGIPNFGTKPNFLNFCHSLTSFQIIDRVMVSESHFVLLTLQVLLIIATAEEDVLVPFGGNQKFLATNFDRDAIETSVSEHSTSPSISDENIGKLRAFDLRSVLDTPQSEWMSTTTVPSHQIDDQRLESQPEQTGEKPPTKDDDFVLVFSHASKLS